MSAQQCNSGTVEDEIHFWFNCQKYTAEQRRKMQENLELMRDETLTLENLLTGKRYHHLWLLQNS